MKTRNLTTGLGILCVCLATALPALAKDDCRGYAIGAGSARVLLKDNRTLPMHLATGECTGTGATSGKCTYKDNDGDEWTDITEWNTGGGLEGTWRSVSGTGKYAKAGGSVGKWKQVRTEPVAVWEISGHCAWANMKKK